MPNQYCNQFKSSVLNSVNFSKTAIKLSLLVIPNYLKSNASNDNEYMYKLTDTNGCNIFIILF